MRRINLLTPNKAISGTIFDELLLARIEACHIHVLAKQGTPMEELPGASHLQLSDLIPTLEQGLTVGGGTGLPSHG